MKQAILVLALAALLGGCVATAPAVVATLDGKPRIPVNKTIPAQPPLAQPSPADTQED